MRFGEMDCMMIQKKPGQSLWAAAQRERQKESEGRLDGNCRQARQSCEETFGDEAEEEETRMFCLLFVGAAEG